MFCATVANNPDKFHFDIGDSRVVPSSMPNGTSAHHNLTNGYIKCVARREETSSLAKEPILQVVERENQVSEQC